MQEKGGIIKAVLTPLNMEPENPNINVIVINIGYLRANLSKRRLEDMFVGCWLLVVWLLVVGCWLLVVGCWFVVNLQSFSALDKISAIGSRL